MLVLSRQVGQSIHVGDDIEISILEVRGAVVKVGISAPQAVAIYRTELGQINRRATLAWRDDDRLKGIARKLRDDSRGG